MPKIRTETLFSDFATLIPQDGSVETIQNYTYFPDANIRIGASPTPGRLILRLERINEENPLLPPPPLNLVPGNFLRIQCLYSFQYRAIRRVNGNMVQLESSMNDDPLPGSQVRRIKSFAQHYVDMRIHGEMEKGNLQIVGGRYYRIDR